MDIIKQQQDEENDALWHIKLGGPDAGGLYRLIDFSQECRNPQGWIDANPILAQAKIDSGRTLSDVFGDYARARRWLYDFRGATIKAITVAAWERVIESRPTTSNDLQIIRIRVKSQVPKP